MLPEIALPKTMVEVGGQSVEVRGLSRSEAMSLAKFKDDPDAAEDFILSCATGETLADIASWRAATPADAVGELIDAVLTLSGLTEGAQKSHP